jgi:hypothetical protein
VCVCDSAEPPVTGSRVAMFGGRAAAIESVGAGGRATARNGSERLKGLIGRVSLCVCMCVCVCVMCVCVCACVFVCARACVYIYILYA